MPVGIIWFHFLILKKERNFFVNLLRLITLVKKKTIKRKDQYLQALVRTTNLNHLLETINTSLENDIKSTVVVVLADAEMDLLLHIITT